MTKTRIKKIGKWLQIIVLIYIFTGLALYLLQDKFIFHPRKLSPDYRYQFDIPFREINLKVTTEKNISMVQFTVPDSLFKGIVLYFHGNRQNINRYAEYVPRFTRKGYEVWMMDYPGYGKSTGVRNEKILYDDALLVYNLALRNVPADHLIIYGKSLGTGIASQLASVKECSKLILETPYYSMEALANHYFFMYPVMLMSKYEFPTYRYFPYIKAPVTIFHGTADEVIPYKQSRWLVSLRPGTELVIIKKGRHNNLPDFPLFQQKLDSLLTY